MPDALSATAPAATPADPPALVLRGLSKSFLRPAVDRLDLTVASGSFYGVAERRASELLDRLGLSPHRNERSEGFSRGMKQKLALAGALVHGPRLIILDEPLTGLDAAAAWLVSPVPET